MSLSILAEDDVEIYVIERLSVLQLLLLSCGFYSGRLYYIDVTWFAAKALELLVLFKHDVCADALRFSSSDPASDSGEYLRLRAHYQEMRRAIPYVEQVFDRWIAKESGRLSLFKRMFLVRQLLPGDFVGSRSGLWRDLLILQAVLAHGGLFPSHGKIKLLLRTHPSSEGLQQYVRKYYPKLKIGFVSGMQEWWRLVFHCVLSCVRDVCVAIVGSVAVKMMRRTAGIHMDQPCDNGARLAIKDIAHFNLNAPSLHSEFFFWQQSEFKGEQILAVFSGMRGDVAERNAQECLNHGMGVIATGRSVFLKNKGLAVHASPVCLWGLLQARHVGKGYAGYWFGCESNRFDRLVSHWGELFDRFGVDVYLTWYKYSEEHCAIAQAIADRGGVFAAYQRSYEGEATPETRCVVDVMFGFSLHSAEVESVSGSIIGHYIITGYVGDHRAELVRADAQALRHTLLDAGAEYVVAFFDENSWDDGRWWDGHEIPRAHYAFLLQQVLSCGDVGLILKPKVPKTLHQRLGVEVSSLLNQAIVTGRCYLFDQGDIQGAIPPVQAALASDVAVHSSVSAATAGVEAILAGVPTLFLDEEGCQNSPFHTIGGSENVFGSFDALWYAIEQHRVKGSRDDNFGRFPDMMDHFDPFRDGRAAERMGTYLQWLMEGYDAGLGKEQVLADANQRYGELWGEDKVISSILPLQTTRWMR